MHQLIKQNNKLGGQKWPCRTEWVNIIYFPLQLPARPVSPFLAGTATKCKNDGAQEKVAILILFRFRESSSTSHSTSFQLAPPPQEALMAIL